MLLVLCNNKTGVNPNLPHALISDTSSPACFALYRFSKTHCETLPATCPSRMEGTTSTLDRFSRRSPGDRCGPSCHLGSASLAPYWCNPSGTTQMESDSDESSKRQTRASTAPASDKMDSCALAEMCPHEATVVKPRLRIQPAKSSGVLTPQLLIVSLRAVHPKRRATPCLRFSMEMHRFRDLTSVNQSNTGVVWTFPAAAHINGTFSGDHFC